MRADRLLTLVDLLRTHGRMSASELARRLEVTRRTVVRDIEALSTMGIPVYAERGRSGGYQLLPGYRPTPQELSAEESQALMLGTAGVADALGMGDAFARAARRLASSMPPDHSQRVDQLLQLVVIDPGGWTGTLQHPPALAALFDAVQRGRQVHAEYHALSSDHGGHGILDPWGLVLADTTWYLVATRAGAAAGQPPHTYRLSRFAHVVVLDTASDRPANLDLQATWRDLRSTYWGNRKTQPVRIRVRRKEVDLVLRSLQIVTTTSAPSVADNEDPEHPIVAAEVTSLRGVVGVLGGYGSWIEVLEPIALRELMVEIAQEVIATHS